MLKKCGKIQNVVSRSDFDIFSPEMDALIQSGEKGSSTLMLLFSWKRLHMMLTVDDQISVRQIAKTFASGRAAERLVYSTLSDCGLPSGKVSSSCYVKLLLYGHRKCKQYSSNLLSDFLLLHMYCHDVLTFSAPVSINR